MKKKKDWVTKAKKRRVKKSDRGIVDLLRIMHHFFEKLPQWINDMTDPRNSSYTIYTQSDLIFMGILKNICAVKTMRSMEEQFNEETCIDTLRILSGDRNLAEMPHSDTLNYYLEKLSPACLADVRKQMVKGLIRMKSLKNLQLSQKGIVKNIRQDTSLLSEQGKYLSLWEAIINQVSTEEVEQDISPFKI